LGDYLDWTRTTHRLPLRATFGEDDKAFAQLDDMVLEGLVKPFVETIRQSCPSFRHKCLGLSEGNHHGAMLSARFRNGRTTTEEICERLGVRYLGLASWIRVTSTRSLGRKRFGTTRNLNILLNHSTSSSGRLAASLSSAQRQLDGWRDVDIFLSGNDHQLGHVLRQELGCTSSGVARPVEFQQVVGKIGSFQKGYQPGAQSENYVERKLLHPSQLGWLAFDAWLYSSELSKGQRDAQGASHSPEVWRYGNFSG